MKDDEFNRLVKQLTEGLPVPLVITRLLLALRVVIHDTGEAGAASFSHYCALRKDRDESAGWEGFGSVEVP